MTVLPAIGIAQEKLPVKAEVNTQKVAPTNYTQPILSSPSPITGPVQTLSDRPPYIQKFSQEKQTRLLRKNEPVPFPKESKPESRVGSLPVEQRSNQKARIMSVIACNDTPVGIQDQYVTATDKTLSIAAPGFLINDIDLEGEALTATTLVDDVDHGTLTAFPNGSFTYTPTPGFVGTDSFQYRMKDASNHASEPITVTIEVRERSNRTPVGSNDIFGALKGTVLVIAAPGFLANDLDQDGDVISATTLVDDVDHGTLTAFPNGSFTYTPSPGYTGPDSFQYRMQDSKGNSSDPITVTIHVFVGNRAPLGTNDIFGVIQNTTRTVAAPGFLVNDVDPDGDAISATTLVDDVDHGTLTAFPNGSFTYTPSAGFTGTDSFQYRMQDSKGNASDPITVTLVVIGPGVLPIGFPDTYRTSKGITLSIAAPGFLMNDIDQNGEALSATTLVDDVDHGTLTAFPNGSFTYTPSPGFVGTDSFQYRMQDASANSSDPITVTIIVEEAFNRKPIGNEDQYGALANVSLSIAAPGFLMNDIDQDGDAISATTLVDDVDHGTLTAFPNGSFTYTPTPGFTGTDSFQYRMQDSKGNASDPVTVMITVYEGNRAPVGTNDVFGVVKNTPLTIVASGFLMNDYDADGDAISATTLVDDVDHGTLTAFPNGSFTYTPNAGFTGTDSFQYRMQDSKGNASDPVTVTLEIISPNQPPVASAGNVTEECQGPSGTQVTLNASGSSDPEGGALTYTWYENNTIIAGPTSSATTQVTFATGVHTVKLKVVDQCGASAETTITVKVQDTNGPLVQAALLPTGKNNLYTVSCSSSDVCTVIASSSSVIRIPNLTNPSVSLKNKKNSYSLDIDTDKNSVSVQAPDAAAFWAKIVADGGVRVNGGQVIDAKYEKNKFLFGFDANGNLTSVKGSVVVLRCTATDGNGNTSMSEASLPMNGVLSLSEISPVGKETMRMLHQNYPNPFSGLTTIRYLLNDPAFVRITIHDQIGHQVDEMVQGQQPAGEHDATWDAGRRPAGIYYYRIQYNAKQVVGKMLYLTP
ncbi:hypothetical protein GCM10023187_45950 [Nibrella viscosa]|uniref:PKD/Chitinase domain-containing protein n=1 Tax=Nibrella viscosa TaxID=1084524 RepID=A0ABP8KTL5_9BACT